MEKLNVKYLENEEFKQIEHFPKYYVSNCGRVYSTKSKHFIGSLNKKLGFITVSLSEGKRTITTYIHDLVMRYFGDEKPSDDFEITHIDEDKTNNNINNLDWIAHAEKTQNQSHYTQDRKKRVGKKEIEAFNRWYIFNRKTLFELSNEALAKKFKEEKQISIHPITIKNNRDRWQWNEKTDTLSRINTN